MIRRRNWVVAAFAVSAGARFSPAVAESRVYRIGVLDRKPPLYEGQWDDFMAEMARRGYVQGRNLTVERRFGGDGSDQATIDKLAGELVSLRPDVIYAAAGAPAALAGKKATTTIPIVFYLASDPVGAGLVASLSRPGGNLTGSSSASALTFSKSLQFLKELRPRLSRFLQLQPPGLRELPWFAQWNAEVIDAARRLGVRYDHREVGSIKEVELVVAGAAHEGVGAMALVGGGPMLRGHQERIAALLIEHRLLSIGPPDSGFLLQYSIDHPQVARKAADYVDKILRGARAADLPVEQVSKFELVINRTTADLLGLQISRSLLLRAQRFVS